MIDRWGASASIHHEPPLQLAPGTIAGAANAGRIDLSRKSATKPPCHCAALRVIKDHRLFGPANGHLGNFSLQRHVLE